MLTATALRLINHVLRGERWALARLAPLAGRTARLEIGPLALPFAIGGDGLFQPAPAAACADVTIHLPEDTPQRWLTDRASVLAVARISGPADLAETLAFVFRNLRWDVEADLSTVTGDILARRFMQGARALFDWQRRGLRNLGAGFAEYITEERPLVTRCVELSDFSAEVAELQRSLERTEKRIVRIEQQRTT